MRDWFKISLDETFDRELFLLENAHMTMEAMSRMEVNDFELYYDKTMEKVKDKARSASEATAT